jgi:AcrR family transcriptional regulator
VDGSGGRRERKKQQTRRLIAQAAERLFDERGFDQVKVSEIARTADVAEKTVFNHFPTKADLLFSGLESYERELLETVRDRPPGESLLSAFRRFVLAPRGLLAETEATERLRAINRMIAESPALLAREQQLFARATSALALLIAARAGADAEDIAPTVAAAALMSVHRALLDYVRRRTLAGAPNRTLLRDAREQGERALALLERGLGRDLVARTGVP